MSAGPTPTPAPASVERTRVVLVTGLSGAGKSTALHALEDLGYFCVDNLPTPVAETTVATCEAGGVRRIALCIDARVGAFLDGAALAVKELERSDRDVSIVFLDASDDALARRFSESRRPHPLSVPAVGKPRRMAVLEGVRIERERLSKLRARATVEIDTTTLNVHELRRTLQRRVDPEGSAETVVLSVTLQSFGFKYGVPLDANLLFDVRFLDNPYFVQDLRPLSGKDGAVREFVLAQRDAGELLTRIEDHLDFVIPRHESEGRSYLTVAIGCTGGRHRSVAVVEELAVRLRAKGRACVVVHRDEVRGEVPRSADPARGGQP